MVNLIGETGKQNADRFIKVLKKLAVDNRHIVMTSDRVKGLDPDCVGWDWMHNADWRSYVHTALLGEHSDLLVHPVWYNPDSAGGWSFSVVSRHASNRTAIMDLNDTIRPGVARHASGVIEYFKRNPIWVGAGLAITCFIVFLAVVAK